MHHGTLKLGIVMHHGTQDQSLYVEFPATVLEFILNLVDEWAALSLYSLGKLSKSTPNRAESVRSYFFRTYSAPIGAECVRFVPGKIWKLTK